MTWVLFVSGLKKILWFIWDHKKAFASGAAIIALLILIGLAYRGCKAKKTVKIDETTLQKVNSADRKERLEGLQETITQNADVVTTVDERNTIQDTSDAEKQLAINQKIADADAKIVEAKKQGRDVTGPELDCMLTGVCQ